MSSVKDLVEQPKKLEAKIMENVLIRGDLAALTAEQKVSYYSSLCHSLGLNPLTQPFEYIVLNGRLVLYAKRSCTDQLRQLHKISIKITKRDLNEFHYSVIANGKTPDGREDEAMGVVTIIGLKGDALANALMKAETKAKRRVALSICGLGFLDENEPETVADAKPYQEPTAEEIYEGTAKPVEYTIPFGKYKDCRIEDVSTLPSGEHDENETALKGYIKFIRDKANAGKKEITGDVKEFLDQADAYLEEIIINRDMNRAIENG